VLLVVGILALAMIVWWIGPTISISNFRPFESEMVRWFQIAFIALAPAARAGWRWYKAKKGNAAIADALLKAPGPPARRQVGRSHAAPAALRGGARPPAADQVRRGATLAVDAAAQALGSQQHLYNLPWYVFIGARAPARPPR